MVERALPCKLFAALGARLALVDSLAALVHRLDVLGEMAAAPKHLRTKAATEGLGHRGLFVVVDGADVVVEVGQGRADAPAQLATDGRSADSAAGGSASAAVHRSRRRRRGSLLGKVG